jgi:hypothetical protein
MSARCVSASRVRYHHRVAGRPVGPEDVSPCDETPLDYFNCWLTEPISVSGDHSVQSVLDALNRHPLAQDETAQNYIMPPSRYREVRGRFRILGENQDTWYCFVHDGAETQRNPPVYFETCLDLKRDHGFADADIIDGNYVLVCPTFTRFLWHMLGQQLCIRTESNMYSAPGVNGVVFKRPVELDGMFVNPLGRDFPAGYTCSFSEGTICVPDWGAAFLDRDRREQFAERFAPSVSRSWPN